MQKTAKRCRFFMAQCDAAAHMLMFRVPISNINLCRIAVPLNKIDLFFPPCRICSDHAYMLLDLKRKIIAPQCFLLSSITLFPLHGQSIIYGKICQLFCRFFLNFLPYIARSRQAGHFCTYGRQITQKIQWVNYIMNLELLQV